MAEKRKKSTSGTKRRKGTDIPTLREKTAGYGGAVALYRAPLMMADSPPDQKALLTNMVAQLIHDGE